MTLRRKFVACEDKGLEGKTLRVWTDGLGTNFTVQDVAGSLVAVVAFALVLYGPGYVVAWAVDLFGFRRKGLPERSCWAVGCSFGVVPIVAYFVGKGWGLGAVCWWLWVVGLMAVGLMVAGHRERRWGRRERCIAWGLAAGWVMFVIASLVDVQVGNKLYFSVVMFDQSYRVAFTDAVARTGVPPANPLYFAPDAAGHAGMMRYYYFWYELCALVMRLAGVTARQAFVASSVWAGFGLIAVIALYVRHFLGVARGVGKQLLVALALLAVTGADLLPAIGSIFAQPALNGEMEWWSIDQFYSWQDSLLWVPHHTASLLCCLLSFLLLWRTREGVAARQRWCAVALAGVAFASAFGLSVYVAFGFGLLLAAWVLRLLVRRGFALSVRVVVMGMVGAGLLVPFVRELAVGGARAGGRAGPLFALSVRRMIDPELLTGLSVFAGARAAHPVLLDTAMRLALLVPGLALELGFYGAVLWVVLRERVLRARREEHVATAVYLAGCGLVMVLFVRSAVMQQNDFGYRAAMLPQFFLLLLGLVVLASWQDSLTKAYRRVLMGLVVLGLAGTVYQGVMLRVFLPLEAARIGGGFEDLPADAFEARRAFAELDRVARKSDVVQVNAEPPVDLRGDVVPPHQFYVRAMLMDSGRQVLNLEPECAVAFGGNPDVCEGIQKATAQLYAADAPSSDWVEGYCRGFGVMYLAVNHGDPAWANKAGWVWTLPVAAEESGFRILRCGAAAATVR